MHHSGNKTYQEEVAAQRKKNVCFDLNHTLNMRPSTGMSQYLVTIKYNEQIDGKESRRLDFKVDYEFLYRLEQMHFVVGVSKYDFFINRKEPSMVMEEIASRISESTNPIQVIIKQQGTVQKIYNMNDLWTRWKTCKKELREEYQGETVEKIFTHLDKKFGNQVKFEGTLTKDIFWNFFFTPLYGRYGKSREQELKLLLPIMTGTPAALFKGICTVESNLTYHNSVELHYQAGASLAGIFRSKGNKSQKPLAGNLNVEYDLDAKSHLPKLINADCTVTEEGSDEIIKNIDVLISRIGTKPASNEKKES